MGITQPVSGAITGHGVPAVSKVSGGDHGGLEGGRE